MRRLLLPLLFLAAAHAQNAPYTLKAGTQRVVVDVVVKDKHGKTIHGLKQSDFLVQENSVPQEIKSFDEHTGLTNQPPPPAPPALPPGQFTNFTPTPQNGTLNIILIDRLNTSQTDQVFLRQQFLDYLKHAHADARTAIFCLTDHLFVLQGFTTDPAALRQALETPVRASVLRDDTLGNAGQEDLRAVTEIQTRNSIDTSAVQAFQAQYQSFQQQIASKYTLDALNQIGRSLVSIPGRKNLIWFAGNFPNQLFPGDGDAGSPDAPVAQFASLGDEYRDTIDRLTSAQIAIYPVDAQGLRPLRNNVASQANNDFARRTSSPLGPNAVQASLNESAGIAREHLGASKIAFETGGEAFLNTNDLAQSVDDAISSGSNFYSLSYSPSNTTAKPDFRRISIKTPEASYSLTYRRGYYVAADRKPTQAVTATGIASAPPLPSTLRRALLQGGPEPTEILLRVKAAPITAGPEAEPLKTNQLNPDQSKSHGPYQDFQIDFATSARALSFSHGADQIYHADLSFLTYVYDGAGNLVNTQTNTLHTSYTRPRVLEILHTGIPFSQQISVPLVGTHTLRVAVHDNLNDNTGAVEIPVAALRYLPLAPASAPPDTHAPVPVLTPSNSSAPATGAPAPK